jgi:hypothetical protein
MLAEHIIQHHASSTRQAFIRLLHPPFVNFL